MFLETHSLGIPTEESVAMLNMWRCRYQGLKIVAGYEKSQFFGPTVSALDGSWSEDEKERVKLEKLISLLK